MFDYRRQFDLYCGENGLGLSLSFGMPTGYGQAYGTFDPDTETVFVNAGSLSGRPDYEKAFYLFHELRHASQLLRPERFSGEVARSARYAILYDGTCCRLTGEGFASCRLNGSEGAFTALYLAQASETDANAFAYGRAKDLFGDLPGLRALYGFWTPERPVPNTTYDAVYAAIDELTGAGTDGIEAVRSEDVTPYLALLDHREENDEFYREAAENSRDIFVLRRGSETVGLSYVDDGTEGFVYVHLFPAFRRKGYGIPAVRAAERLLRNRPVRIMTGYVSGDGAAEETARRGGYIRKYSSAVMRYRGGRFPEPDLSVRKYRDEDFEEAFALSAEAFHRMRLGTGLFPDNVQAVPDGRVRRHWSETAGERYVLTADGEIAGHAKLDGDTIESVSIRISRQGQGLGRRFLQYLANRVLDGGYGEVRLWCIIGNDRARHLYDSLGFEETGRADYAEKKIPVPACPERGRNV